MKESKECAKPPKPPQPNMKNKDFVKWSKSESCKREDNIVSTEWHETLKRTLPFVPEYGRTPLSMVYLLSGEYGRLWQKERDEWYSKVFVPTAREKDMKDRRARVRREAREAKKAAEKSIKERKERKAKEAEEKAKAEADRAEKLRARLKKNAPLKKQVKPLKKKEVKEVPAEPEEKQEGCLKGAQLVELSLGCECSAHEGEKKDGEKPGDENKERPSAKHENEGADARQKTQGDSTKADEPCTLCGGYLSQLKNIQDKKTEEFQKEVGPESRE